MGRKKIVALLALLIASLLVLFAVFSNQQPAAQTIFDEIFADEIQYLRSHARSSTRLTRINGANLITDKESSDFQSGLVLVTYQSDQFPDNSNLNIMASDKDKLILNFEETLTDKVQLSLIDTYDVSRKELVRTIKISDYNTEAIQIPQSSYETYFKKYGLDKEKIQERFTLFETIFLKEWVSVYNSQFTPDSWGDVKITDKW